MKKLFLLHLLVVIFVCVSLTAAEANELKNADFEAGDISDWSTWCVTGEVSMLENHTPGGSHSAAPTLNDPKGPYNIGGLVQEVSNVYAGDNVKASCWIKTDNFSGGYDAEAQAILKLEFWGGGVLVSSKEAGRLSGSNDWQEVSIDTAAPEGAELVKVILLLWNTDGTGSTGKAYFDDVRLAISR
jgi:hypothetical protein